MNDTFIELAKQHTDWSSKVYPLATELTAVTHLSKEVDELREALTGSSTRAEIGFEYADCFLLLIDGSKRAGFTIEEMVNFIKIKISINKERKWQRNDDGTYTHIKKENE